MPIFLVMAGGAIGAGARYLVGRGFASAPYATLTVNLAGGLLMGLLVGLLARFGGTTQWRLFLGTGVLGGFTTFSSFSLDMVTMIERGQPGVALGYALASVVGAGVALFAGMTLARIGA